MWLIIHDGIKVNHVSKRALGSKPSAWGVTWKRHQDIVNGFRTPPPLIYDIFIGLERCITVTSHKGWCALNCQQPVDLFHSWLTPTPKRTSKFHTAGGDQWIPLTKGPFCGLEKGFNIITSSSSAAPESDMSALLWRHNVPEWKLINVNKRGHWHLMFSLSHLPVAMCPRGLFHHTLSFYQYISSDNWSYFHWRYMLCQSYDIIMALG